MSISSQDKRIRRMTLDAMLVSFAMLLSFLESILPLQLLIPIPGMKLGLSNVVVMIAFCLLSPWEAAIVSSVRILCMALLFGTVTSFAFSAMGGLLSFLALLLASKLLKKSSYLGVSVLSAAAHNTGQILVASLLFDPSLLISYLPLLLLASVLYGGALGCLMNALMPRLETLVRQLVPRREAVE